MNYLGPTIKLFIWGKLVDWVKLRFTFLMEIGTVSLVDGEALFVDVVVVFGYKY